MSVEITCWGDITYCENGEFHRAGGLPAMEYPDGSKHYFENGKLHRAGGLPATDWTDGLKEYYENGKEYSKE